MRVYHDLDADLGLLEERQIAVIGYGNQGRAQALNLRDSGMDVIIGNREDEYAQRAREDGFAVHPIQQAAAKGDILLLLFPDEVMPEVLEGQIAPCMAEGDVLVFASGYNIAFELFTPPPGVDVVLVAPRMIGAGVRDLYLAGRGFPSFIGLASDHSGQAKAIALALAKGIGSTRVGAVEVTFAQEAELDLFTEQCFGPAFGNVLMTAVDLLLEEGYPPEAVLLELYMSGELSYTLGKIAQLGMIEQSTLHSRTSQYGSLSRGMRFRLPELRERMREGLEEIRSGAFAQEWAAEQAEGCPTLEILRESARTLPLHKLETDLRKALHGLPQPHLMPSEQDLAPFATTVRTGRRGPLARALGWLVQGIGRLGAGQERQAGLPSGPLSRVQMEGVLQAFIARAKSDPALLAFARGRQVTTHYVMSDRQLQFYLRFQDDAVAGGMGPPPFPAEVRLTMDSDVLDGMLAGRINAAGAAMSGRLSFDGDTRLAMSVQRIQKDLTRLYRLAREEVTSRQA